MLWMRQEVFSIIEAIFSKTGSFNQPRPATGKSTGLGTAVRNGDFGAVVMTTPETWRMSNRMAAD